jgi:transcription initiation factor TFIID subunit 5
MLVSGGADWTVRCWDVRGAGGPGKSRESGGAESTITRTIDDENNETCVPCNIAHAIDIDIAIRSDLLATFPTKRTPITNVHFTPRNLCLVAGNFLAPDSR